MQKTVGKLSDLGKPLYRNGNKERYDCPYCVTVYNKRPEPGTISFDVQKHSGFCFRCHTVITSDGLPNLEYIQESLNPYKHFTEEEKAKNQRYNLDWTKPIMYNKRVWEYLNNRFITNESMYRFNVRSCTDPYLGVVYVNKVIDDIYTDSMQIRIIEGDKKHVFLRDQLKVLNWLCYADSNNIVVTEGFTSGMSAYQHSKKLDFHLNPVILGGKSITDYQILELKEYCNKYKEANIWICLDGGFYEEALKVSNKIYQSCYNSNIYIINLPYGEDPNEIEADIFVKSFNESEEFKPNRLRKIRTRVYGNVKNSRQSKKVSRYRKT